MTRTQGRSNRNRRLRHGDEAFARAAFDSIGIASSRLPSTTSTCPASSPTLARTFSLCGGTKWIMRSSRAGRSRSGAGAPMASGSKNLRGAFMDDAPVERRSGERGASRRALLESRVRRMRMALGPRPVPVNPPEGAAAPAGVAPGSIEREIEMRAVGRRRPSSELCRTASLGRQARLTRSTAPVSASETPGALRCRVDETRLAVGRSRPARARRRSASRRRSCRARRRSGLRWPRRKASSKLSRRSEPSEISSVPSPSALSRRSPAASGRARAPSLQPAQAGEIALAETGEQRAEIGVLRATATAGSRRRRPCPRPTFRR